MKWGILVLISWLVLIGCNSVPSIEDPTAKHFIKFYGKEGDQTGEDLVVLPDGSMVLFGTSRPTVSARGSQWYLVKVDAKGTVLWEREFGGLLDDEARDIELTTANQLVLVGNTYISATNRDVKIMTWTTDGDSIGSAVIPVRDVLGVDAGKDEDVTSVSETLDGFLISGSTTYVPARSAVAGLTDIHDALNIRVFTNLTEYPNSWPQTNGYYSDDVSQKVVQVSPSLYYAFGYTNSGQTVPNYNFWAYSMGVNGVPSAQQLYPGTTSGNEKLTSWCISPIGYFLGGLSQSSSAASNLFVSELGTPGPLGFEDTNILYEKSISIDLGSNLDGRSSVFPSKLGGFYIMADENGFNNNQNWVLTKVSNDGNAAWSTPIVFGGEGLDACGAIQELSDGRLIMIGTMRTGRPDVGEFKLTLVKVNGEGKFEN